MVEPAHQFKELSDDIVARAREIDGFLSDSEIRFLSLLAAHPVADGEILEIGSFKGRSTFVLAESSRIAGDDKINAVDPLIAPSETDPDLGDDDSSEKDFKSNIEKSGVEERVKLYQEFSYKLAERWDKPIRLLWIDGDHTYKGTKADLDGFEPHLSDGAIVAIHDVLHEFEGGVRVFAEDMLLSDNYGACGFVDSIGWAQFRKDPKDTIRFRDEKMALYKKVSRLIPLVSLGRSPSGMSKKHYKILRWLVPHKGMEPGEWLARIPNLLGSGKNR